MKDQALRYHVDAELDWFDDLFSTLMENELERELVSNF